MHTTELVIWSSVITKSLLTHSSKAYISNVTVDNQGCKQHTIDIHIEATKIIMQIR